MKIKLFITLMLFFSTVRFFNPTLCVAQSYQQMSLFTDHRARQVGDIVTILIVEYSSAKSEANSSNEKTSDHGVQATGGPKSESYMPMFGLRGKFNNGFDNSGETSRKGSLTGKITATISEVKPNGTLVINGTRVVAVNGETEKILINGVIRAEDIRSDNTIFSYQVADAQISYAGKGIVSKGQKPGMLDKLLGWIF